MVRCSLISDQSVLFKIASYRIHLFTALEKAAALNDVSIRVKFRKHCIALVADDYDIFVSSLVVFGIRTCPRQSRAISHCGEKGYRDVTGSLSGPYRDVVLGQTKGQSRENPGTSHSSTVIQRAACSGNASSDSFPFNPSVCAPFH